jgi:mannosyltransferase
MLSETYENPPCLRSLAFAGRASFANASVLGCLRHPVKANPQMQLPSGKHWDRLTPAIPLILAAIALAVRLYGLSDKPLWLDEIITQRRANLAVPELIANSLHYRHFPTYFLLVRAFDAPLIDEWMLRLPSALFGAVSVLLVALIGTEVRSRWAGIVAAGLMTLAPLEVQYAQEARPYTLFSCLVLLALWGLVRIGQQTALEVRSSTRSGGQLGSWLAYAIGTIGALHVLLMGAVWLITANLAAIAIFRHAGPGRTDFVRKWAWVQAIIVLTWVPWLIAMARAVGADPLRGIRWIPPTTLDHAWKVLSTVYLLRPSSIVTFELLPTPVPILGVAIAAFALLGAWRLRSRPTSLAIIGLSGLAVPIAIFVISLFQPILVPRYFLLSTGPFFVLAGIGVTALPHRLSLVATAAVIAFAITSLAVYYRSETKPRWDLAAAYLAENVQSGDSVTANDHMARYVLAAYGDRYHLDRNRIQAINPQSAEAALRNTQEGSIWVIYGRTGQGAIGPEQTYFKQWHEMGLPTCRRQFGLNVVVLRLDRSAAGPGQNVQSPPCSEQR